MSADDSSRLIYATVVDTPLGNRDVGVYWAPIERLVFAPAETLVVVSTSVFQRNQNLGGAWRALHSEFDKLQGGGFTEVIRCGLDSVWKPQELAETWSSWCEKEAGSDTWPPAILTTRVHDDGETPRRVLLARTMPYGPGKAGENDYWTSISMVYAAFRALEAVERTSRQAESSSDSVPSVAYRRILMSALGGRQHYPVGELLKCLVDEAKKWLLASPQLERVDIAYFEKEAVGEEQTARRDAVRRELVGVLGDTSCRTNELLKPMLEKLGALLQDAIQSTDGQFRNLTEALRDMFLVVDRTTDGKDLLLREFGAAAGRLTEALVHALNVELLNSPPPTFEKGIDRLRNSTFKSGRAKDAWISKWFHSYLHTLRVLRNECAHTFDPEPRQKQFPRDLEQEDLLLLVVALRRVLLMYNQWRRESPD